MTGQGEFNKVLGPSPSSYVKHGGEALTQSDSSE